MIREEVAKVEGQAQANRFHNYPYAAIEEVLANAVYHRSYELQNTIEVNVRLDQIEVLSFPGPLPPVDNEMLQNERITARDYRNRRIGDFLKELQLTEGRSTGFPKIYKAMERNGSPEPVFETDESRTYFLAKLPIHNKLKDRGQAGAQAEAQGQNYDFHKTERAILAYLTRGPSSQSEIIDYVGSGGRSGHFKWTLQGLLEKELVAYTRPNSPQSKV